MSSTTTIGLSDSYQQSLLADWFSSVAAVPILLLQTRGSLEKTSTVSSTTQSMPPLSSTSSSGRSTPSANSDGKHISGGCGMIFARQGSTEADDSWGQFVDTAEAEQEIVKHSRVLSRKELPEIPVGYQVVHR